MNRPGLIRAQDAACSQNTHVIPFFQIWRDRRDARVRLSPLGAALGFKLAVEAP